MATSYRVQKDQFGSTVDHLGPEFVTEQLKNGKWGIWEIITDYSSVSGQTLKRGHAVRRWELEAGLGEGELARFDTKEAAQAYYDRHLCTRKPKKEVADGAESKA